IRSSAVAAATLRSLFMCRPSGGLRRLVDAVAVLHPRIPAAFHLDRAETLRDEFHGRLGREMAGLVVAVDVDRDVLPEPGSGGVLPLAFRQVDRAGNAGLREVRGVADVDDLVARGVLLA